MFCPKCGKKNEGNAKFCASCGAMIQKNQESTGNAPNKFEEKTQSKESKPKFNPEKVRSCLISEQEQVLNVLGNTWAETFFATGTIGNGFSILTNERVYFKGKCFIRIGKGFYKKVEEKVVDLNEVTGTGFVHNKAVWAHVLAIIFTVIGGLYIFSGVPNFIVGIFTRESQNIIAGVVGGVVGLLLIVLFQFLDKMFNYSVFEISYAGGGIAFGLNWISQDEANEFQRLLRQAKDAKKAESLDAFRTILRQPEAGAKNQDTKDSAAEILKFKELLDKGVITQEEFEAKKKQLLDL